MILNCVNPVLRYAYIHVPKTAGFFLNHNLIEHYGFVKLIDKNRAPFYYPGCLRSYKKMLSVDDATWESFDKFCFVRNPYTRLVSAFNYCMSVQKKKHVIFEKFWKEKKCTIFEFEIIYMRQHQHIEDDEGNIPMHFIGRFETLETDFQCILRDMGFEDDAHDMKKKINTTDHSKPLQFYITNNDLLAEINAFFHRDFELFGYDMVWDIRDLPKYDR